MKIYILLFHLFFGYSLLSIAQTDTDRLLANEYYQQGEYEKALALYSKLAKSPMFAYDIHRNYLDALLKLQKTDDAEKYLKKQVKANPDEVMFNVDYAQFLIQQGKHKDANKVLDEYINHSKKEAVYLQEDARYMMNMGLFEYAEKLYLIARKTHQWERVGYDLGNLYYMWGKIDLMIREYLDLIVEESGNMETVRAYLQYRVREDEDYEKLEVKLLEYIQKYPDQSVFSELFVWFLTQRKEFYQAFLQAKAIDKRRELEGRNLFEIGEMALGNKDYKAAVKIFDYLVTTYKNKDIYQISRFRWVKAREEEIKTTFPVDKEKIRALVQDYSLLLDEMGIHNDVTAEAARSYAQLQAFYLGHRDSAILVLQKVISGRSLGIQQEAIDWAKLDLGDIYLLKGEPWEATLLYSQVEKTQRERNMGHLAKLKNAKLHYYKGDFELAKSQLDILKSATTREIANDAMEMSLLIGDNLELDTSATALNAFAAIELLSYQGQDEDALTAYSKLLKDFPQHPLSDEVYWNQAKIYIKQGRWQEAITVLDRLLAEFGEDILADDAHFTLATIYEEKLNNKSKAMEMYQQQLLKYQGSIHTAEARKRFRILRGDTVN